jgi:hypothetical protein
MSNIFELLKKSEKLVKSGQYTQAKEPTVQFRKLVKSMEVLKFLLGKL